MRESLKRESQKKRRARKEFEARSRLAAEEKTRKDEEMRVRRERRETEMSRITAQKKREAEEKKRLAETAAADAMAKRGSRPGSATKGLESARQGVVTALLRKGDVRAPPEGYAEAPAWWEEGPLPSDSKARTIDAKVLQEVEEWCDRANELRAQRESQKKTDALRKKEGMEMARREADARRLEAMAEEEERREERRRAEEEKRRREAEEEARRREEEMERLHRVERCSCVRLATTAVLQLRV